MGAPAGYPIGYVSLSTGLTTHTLRAWERRYQAVAPTRTKGGRRRYARKDIDRLLLLKRALAAGHRISAVAGLASSQLADLIHVPDREAVVSAAAPRTSHDPAYSVQATLAACLSAIAALDGIGLQVALQEAAFRLNRQTILETVISPLMAEVGRQWAQGRMRIVQGHLAACIVGTYLDRMLETAGALAAGSPRVVIAAPAGQWCDLGARAVAVTARDHGWEPVQLGANLPCEEIGAACDILRPQAVALSITSRIDDAYMRRELERLAGFIDGDCVLLAGGHAVERYRACIEAGGGTVCRTAGQFLARLD